MGTAGAGVLIWDSRPQTHWIKTRFLTLNDTIHSEDIALRDVHTKHGVPCHEVKSQETRGDEAGDARTLADFRAARLAQHRAAAPA